MRLSIAHHPWGSENLPPKQVNEHEVSENLTWINLKFSNANADSTRHLLSTSSNHHIFGNPLYHDIGYLSMANNVKNPVLEPCCCHAGTLLLPRWNLATATLQLCYCHAGTLLLPRWNLATATLEPCYCHAGTLLLPRWRDKKQKHKKTHK